MPRHAGRNDFAACHIDGCEQGRCPITLVVVRHRPASTGHHRQTGLGAIQCLDLALFIGAEHERSLRRIEVQTDHVDQLLLEPRVAAQFEGPDQMRLEPIGFPHPVHERLGDPQLCGQAARTPMGGVLRRTLRRLADDLALNLLPLIPWTTATRQILLNATQAQLRKAAPPSAHGVRLDRHRGGDLLVRPAVGCQQDDPGPLNLSHRNRASCRPSAPASIVPLVSV